MSGPLMDPFARLVENATVAVDAYVQRVLPNRPPETQVADRICPETMHCLLSDLLHFCDRHGLDFAEILAWARSSHADDLAMEQTFAIGDEVQPRIGAIWRGIVVGVQTTLQNEVLYTVRIPGERDHRVMPVEDLETAASFGPVHTGEGRITTVQEAEGRLEQLSLLIRRTEHDGRLPARELYTEQRALVAALADWSGGTGTSILQLLGPRIAVAIERERNPSPTPTELAGTAFPNDIAAGLTNEPPLPRAETEAPKPGPTTSDGQGRRP